MHEKDYYCWAYSIQLDKYKVRKTVKFILNIIIFLGLNQMNAEVKMLEQQLEQQKQQLRKLREPWDAA